jgi:hypothetical protein
VLGVDTARQSGWAVWARGHLVARGEVDTLDAAAVRAVVASTVAGAAELELPAVLVLERPWGGNVHIVTALGAARERWQVAWRELAAGHLGRVLTVSPSTWRSAELGAYFASAKREECRDAERSMARGYTGAADVGGDEAPAICIGHWASRAGEVGKLLGKRAQRASLAAWGAA